jgi:hypothetical protein
MDTKAPTIPIEGTDSPPGLAGVMLARIGVVSESVVARAISIVGHHGAFQFVINLISRRCVAGFVFDASSRWGTRC